MVLRVAQTKDSIPQQLKQWVKFALVFHKRHLELTIDEWTYECILFPDKYFGYISFEKMTQAEEMTQAEKQ